MRILFIHEVNYLTKPIFEMHEIPEAMAELGHQVGFVHFPENESRQALRQRGFHEIVPGRSRKASRIELFTPRTSDGGIVGRLLTAVTFSFQFRRVLEEFVPDVVFSFSVPTSGWQALRICKKEGIPYLFRALDVSRRIRKSPFGQLVSIAEKYIFKNADWISANNKAMLDYVIEAGGEKRLCSVDLPPLDTGMFPEPIELKAVSKDFLGLDPDSDVIVFLGSFFYFSGLPQLIEAFAELSQANQFLLLLGSGEQSKQLRDLVNHLGISKRVIFTGFVDFETIPLYLSIADIGVNSFSRSEVSDKALPNKVLQYMAAALPVVTTRLEGLERTLGHANPGVCFVDTQREVIQKSLKLIENKDALAKIGLANKRLAEELFSKEKLIPVFSERLTRLIESKS